MDGANSRDRLWVIIVFSRICNFSQLEKCFIALMCFSLFCFSGKPVPVTPSSLVECSVCFDICHPHCVGFDSKDIIMNDDLPNSWECPQCNDRSRNLKARHQKPRSRKMSISSAGSSAPTTDSERATTPSKRSRPDQNDVIADACYFIIKCENSWFIKINK